LLLIEQRVAEALKSCEHGYMLETRRVMLEDRHRALVGRRPPALISECEEDWDAECRDLADL
jgi:hypothetical protein